MNKLLVAIFSATLLSGCAQLVMTGAALLVSGAATTYQADRCAEIARQAQKDGADGIETKRRLDMASCK